MILTCNSCAKKFVVPDAAITISGRMVQCGSCGNKWKQFPVDISDKSQSVSKVAAVVSKPRPIQKKIQKPKKVKKSNVKKPREVSLYSPEYLAKKHGIKINDTDFKKKVSKIDKDKGKVSFGFYNSLILFLVIIIAFSKVLHFSQELIVQLFPFTEYYLDYFFETIRNMFEIWKNLITSY